MGYAFISHSNADMASANLILAALERRGVKCWMAPRDLPATTADAEAILGAIERASCFVLVYSKHANRSKQVLREVERAVKIDVNIVPVRFDSSAPSKSLDYLLSTWQWLYISEPVKAAVAKAADRIASSLRQAELRPFVPIESPAPIIVRPRRRLTNNPLVIGAALVLLVLALCGSILLFLRSQSASSPVWIGVKPDSSDRSNPAPGATEKSAGDFQLNAGAIDQKTEKEIRDFIANFVRDSGGDDVIRRVAYFTNPAHHFGRPNASPEELRKDFELENANNKIRNYSLVTAPMVIKTGATTFSATCEVRFHLENPKPPSDGVFGIRMILEAAGNSYRIASIDKTSAPTPSPAQRSAHHSHHRKK
jgi:hypothetical protein